MNNNISNYESWANILSSNSDSIKVTLASTTVCNNEDMSGIAGTVVAPCGSFQKMVGKTCRLVGKISSQKQQDKQILLSGVELYEPELGLGGTG